MSVSMEALPGDIYTIEVKIASGAAMRTTLSREQAERLLVGLAKMLGWKSELTLMQPAAAEEVFGPGQVWNIPHEAA